MEAAFVTVNLILVVFELSTSLLAVNSHDFIKLVFRSTHLILNYKSLTIYLCAILNLRPGRKVRHNNDATR